MLAPLPSGTFQSWSLCYITMSPSPVKLRDSRLTNPFCHLSCLYVWYGWCIYKMILMGDDDIHDKRINFQVLYAWNKWISCPSTSPRLESSNCCKIYAIINNSQMLSVHFKMFISLFVSSLYRQPENKRQLWFIEVVKCKMKRTEPINCTMYI